MSNDYEFSFKLISLKNSIQSIPEDTINDQINEFKKQIKSGKITLKNEEKIESVEESEEQEEKLLQRNEVHFTDCPYHFLDDPLMDYVNNDYTIVAFDESSRSYSGTYARLAYCKFGEGQLKFDGDKYEKEKIMYSPIDGYIRDDVHKLKIYKNIGKQFVDTIEQNFYKGEMKNSVKDLKDWYQNTFAQDLDDDIQDQNYLKPTLGHVVDRLRTTDEILKSLIRVKELSKCGKKKNIIFLGDGIHLFHNASYPPIDFTDFFYDFLHEYEVKYVTFSKTCRLRDFQGNFILPAWGTIIKNDPFLVELPEISNFSRSKSFLVRLQESSPVLRYDVPEFYALDDAIEILNNLRAYAPMGYPLCLEDAHHASDIIASEKSKLEGKFFKLKHDVNSQAFIENYREQVLSSDGNN
ncbi:MAG: hypothetical protein R6U96_05835 [Promethearchaeia archaeon]